MQLWWRGKDAVVTFRNDAVVGPETINDWFAIPWDNLFRRGQGWIEQTASQHRAAHEAVKAVTSVIRMQRDQALKGVRTNFCFEQAHFRFGRIAPELTI